VIGHLHRRLLDEAHVAKSRMAARYCSLPPRGRSPASLAGACLLLIALLAGTRGFAATVNWLDPLAYPKPAAIDVAMPPEASATKYWVDFTKGGDSPACGTMAKPCATLRGLADRNLPGLAGKARDAAAYVYLRGRGNFYLYNNRFAGTPGKEIVIKPWPGQRFVSEGETPGLGYDRAENMVHDIIIDGGPDLAIAFASTEGGGGPKYALHVNADNVTIYRTQFYATTQGTLLAVSDYGAVFSNNRFINNEFHGCNQSPGHQCVAIYVGACSNPGSCGFKNLAIRNNIMREIGGEAIEINPRVPSSGLEISGNAIHNVGKQTCAGDWDCRPGITVDGPSARGSTSDVVIRDNLIWDTGGSCIWDKGGGNSALIVDNVCYDFAKIKGKGVCQQGICADNRGMATIKNNIIYAPNGSSPMDGSAFTAVDNICAPDKACGHSHKAWSSAMVRSLDQDSRDFMVRVKPR
jgi:hypothetical protein